MNDTIKYIEYVPCVSPEWAAWVKRMHKAKLDKLNQSQNARRQGVSTNKKESVK